MIMFLSGPSILMRSRSLLIVILGKKGKSLLKNMLGCIRLLIGRRK